MRKMYKFTIWCKMTNNRQVSTFDTYGLIRVKQNVFLPQVKILIHYWIAYTFHHWGFEKKGKIEVEWGGKTLDSEIRYVELEDLYWL